MFLKDSIFEASSPTRDTAELAMLLKNKFPNVVALVVYTDGGPDHNNKHTSVRLGLLSLFIELNFGYHGGNEDRADSKLGESC